MRFGALVTIVARFLAVIACNMRKILGAFWHLLMSWARHGGIRTANGCSFMLGVGRSPAVLCCVMLLGLLDLVVVGPSLGFVLVKRDIVSPAAPHALCFLGLEGFYFHHKLLKLVSDVKQTLSFEYCLLYY